METDEAVAELRRLGLERRGEYVVATRASPGAAVLEELGVLLRDRRRTVLDESHPLVEAAVARAGELFWREKDYVPPRPPEEAEAEKEEQRWLLKQMLLPPAAKGVAPSFPVLSPADLARLLQQRHDARAGRRMRGGESPFVAVLSGAGISVAAGIPDFRSKGTGFYDSFDPAAFGLRSAEDVFSLEQFRADPMPFLRVERKYGGLYASEKFRPTGAHRFFAALAARGMLLREFTQNVDGLSFAAGVPEAQLVEAHGSYRRAHCVSCGKEADIALVQSAIFSGPEPEVPRCPACRGGVLKPQCTFFGEKLPARFWKERQILRECDVLIVAGTSLQVEPFASLVDEVAPACVRVLLNREAVGPFAEGVRDARSFALLGDIETTIAALAAALGWPL